jgi:hypothetical protein
VPWKPSRTALAVACLAEGSLERKGAKSISCRAGSCQSRMRRTNKHKAYRDDQIIFRDCLFYGRACHVDWVLSRMVEGLKSRNTKKKQKEAPRVSCTAAVSQRGKDDVNQATNALPAAVSAVARPC